MSDTPHINVDYFESLTGKISAETEKNNIEQIGERIKSIRKEKGLSLSDIAKLTGFDEKFLENIENNKIQPQLGTIIKLSKALDSAFARLISGEGSNLYSITRSKDQKIVSRSTSRTGGKEVYLYKSLAPEVQGRHMEAFIVQLHKYSENEMAVHSGEEFIYVLKGVAELRIDNKVLELNPGDSAYYFSNMPHIITAKDDEAVIVAVMYSDGE